LTPAGRKCDESVRVRRVFLSATSAALAALCASAAWAASYRVYPQPTASPDHGPRELVVNPADPVRSAQGPRHDPPRLRVQCPEILHRFAAQAFLQHGQVRVPAAAEVEGVVAATQAHVRQHQARPAIARIVQFDGDFAGRAIVPGEGKDPGRLAAEDAFAPAGAEMGLVV